MKAIDSKLDFMNSDKMREVEIHFKLADHENIVKYQDCFFDEFNYFYLVLEYCNGGSLDIKIKAKTKFSFDKILQWSKEIIFGIEYLHNHNIVHRNIKAA
jgi:serine/threonine protein kinase